MPVQRVNNCVPDCGGDGDDTAFAGALESHRVEFGRRFLQRDSGNFGQFGAGRQQVIGKAACQQLPVFVIDHVIEECTAKALHQAADRLALNHRRVQRPADFLRQGVFFDLDHAGRNIDGDQGRVGAVGVRELSLVIERGIG